MAKQEEQKVLKGWAAIAGFLGQPVSTAQRWAKSGMPVRRAGRYVTAEPGELKRWLGREIGAPKSAPVTLASKSEDLGAALRQSLMAAKHRKKR